MLDDALNVPNFLTAQRDSASLRVAVPCEVKDTQIEAQAEYAVDHGDGLQFGAVVSMQVDEAIFVVLFFEAVEGDHQFIIVEVYDLKILPKHFAIAHESDTWAQIEGVVCLTLWSYEEVFY